MKISISVLHDKLVTAKGGKPFTGIVNCPICNEQMKLKNMNSGISDLDPYYFHYECGVCDTEVKVYATEETKNKK